MDEALTALEESVSDSERVPAHGGGRRLVTPRLHPNPELKMPLREAQAPEMRLCTRLFNMSTVAVSSGEPKVSC